MSGGVPLFDDHGRIPKDFLANGKGEIKMSKTIIKSSGGIGFLGLLTLIFITLKLTSVITWSWLWVLAPLWMPVAVVLLIAGFIGITCFVALMTRACTDKRSNDDE